MNLLNPDANPDWAQRSRAAGPLQQFGPLLPTMSRLCEIQKVLIASSYTVLHLHLKHFNPFTADPVKALHFAILV